MGSIVLCVCVCVCVWSAARGVLVVEVRALRDLIHTSSLRAMAPLNGRKSNAVARNASAPSSTRRCGTHLLLSLTLSLRVPTLATDNDDDDDIRFLGRCRGCTKRSPHTRRTNARMHHRTRWNFAPHRREVAIVWHLAPSVQTAGYSTGSRTTTTTAMSIAQTICVSMGYIHSYAVGSYMRMEIL